MPKERCIEWAEIDFDSSETGYGFLESDFLREETDCDLPDIDFGFLEMDEGVLEMDLGLSETVYG